MKISSNKLKAFRTTIIVWIIFSWVFSGWPLEIKKAQAAVSFVGSAINSSSPNTGTTVTLPAGIITDDLIIVVAAVGDTVSNGMAAPTEGGYTRIGSATIYSNDVNDVNLDMYYKFHNGLDPTASFAAVGGANASNAAIVMVFRGVDPSSPFDTTVSPTSGIDTSNADPPSHDWSGTAGVWTVAVGATGYNGTGTGTFTAPTGYTTDFAQRTHNDTIDVLVGVGYKSSPSDPENPGAFTAATVGTAADNAWAAATISLKPAVPADLTWNTGAADFEIWAGANSTADASLIWDNGTLICSTSLTDDNGRISTCGALNKSQKYRIQTVLKNIGGGAANMAAEDYVNHKNVKTFWAGTSPTISAATDCGFNDIGADNGATICNVAFSGNDVRISNSGGGNVQLAATTGSEGLMYLITTDSNVSLSDSSSYTDAFIDGNTEDSSRITIGLKRAFGLFVRGKTMIRGKIKFR